MGMLKEFKEFALKGNVIDLAVAVIIGGAFGKVVSSMVADIIMPPIGLLLGGVDFTDLKIVLKQGAEGVDPVTLNYGFFFQQVIDFIIIAFAVFMVVKLYQSTQRKRQEVPPAVPIPTNEEKLLAEIRDLLKKQTP